MKVIKRVLVASILTLVGFGVLGSSTAQAYDNYAYSPGYGGYAGYRNGPGPVRSGPIYHPPSVHYDRVYHADYTHWTPGRGWHTHGHQHIVPHYVPGHFDHQHGDHIHVNPRFHHR